MASRAAGVGPSRGDSPLVGWDLRASTYPFYDPADQAFAVYPWSPHDDGWDMFEWGADAPDERESLYTVHERLARDPSSSTPP